MPRTKGSGAPKLASFGFVLFCVVFCLLLKAALGWDISCYSCGIATDAVTKELEKTKRSTSVLKKRYSIDDDSVEDQHSVPFLRSEVRLIEAMESACEPFEGEDKTGTLVMACQQVLEDHEQDIEEWYFSKTSLLSLKEYLCEHVMQKCDGNSAEDRIRRHGKILEADGNVLKSLKTSGTPILIKFDLGVSKYQAEYNKISSSIIQKESGPPDVLLAQVKLNFFDPSIDRKVIEEYGLDRDKIPAFKLVLPDGDNDMIPTVYASDELGRDANGLVRYLKKYGNVEVNLNGNVEKFDKLAQKFVETQVNERGFVAKEMYKEWKTLYNSRKDKSTAAPEKMIESAYVYHHFMREIMNNGISYVKREYDRLSKESVNPSKRQELEAQMNILATFLTAAYLNEKS
eukprot:Nk52_evm28s621 gene=Nk52_evmTU28s621